jgi:tRNA pseudouridine55 synthase
MDFENGQLLLVDKPRTWTSFDVVNKLRYALKKQTGKKMKVGHAGTLDPLATGLLLICTGKMTKQIDSLTGLNKEYTGTFFIGATTPCYDAEMPADKTYPTEHITEELLRQTTKQFTGVIQQVPPIYSALRVEGQKAYNMAREGEEVKMKSREVEVTEFEITRIALPEVDFRIVCSKGTYIRSIANDYGQALNSGAYLQALCRTAISEYRIEEAKSVEEWLEVIASS